MNFIRNFAAAVIGTAGLLAASQAGATTVTYNAAGDSNTITFTCSNCSSGISGSIQMTLSSFNVGTRTAVFAVVVTNNSTLAADRLVSFGFGNLTPNITSASDNSAMWSETLNTNFPGFQTVELCVWAGQNCAGGGNGGVAGAGGSSSFNLTLVFAAGTTIPPITFDGWYTKFQGPNGSFELPGDTDTDTDTDTDVPEPGTLALLGLGLMGLGAVRRRKA